VHYSADPRHLFFPKDDKEIMERPAAVKKDWQPEPDSQAKLGTEGAPLDLAGYVVTVVKPDLADRHRLRRKFLQPRQRGVIQLPCPHGVDAGGGKDSVIAGSDGHDLVPAGRPHPRHDEPGDPGGPRQLEDLWKTTRERIIIKVAMGIDKHELAKTAQGR
jgi:hypothetical protein